MNALRNGSDDPVRLKVALQEPAGIGDSFGWLERVLIVGYAGLTLVVAISSWSDRVTQERRTHSSYTLNILDDYHSK